MSRLGPDDADLHDGDVHRLEDRRGNPVVAWRMAAHIEAHRIAREAEEAAWLAQRRAGGGAELGRGDGAATRGAGDARVRRLVLVVLAVAELAGLLGLAVWAVPLPQ